MHYAMQKHTGEYPIVGVNTLQEAPATLKRIPPDVNGNGIAFAVLMEDAERCRSLSEITSAISDVGGQYRRGM